MTLHTLTEPIRRRSERGAAALEFALCLPLLITLVFGIIEFGRGYNAKIELTGAVREGARELALGKTAAQAQATVQNAAPTVGSLTFSGIQTCASGATGNATITAHLNMPFDIPFVDAGTWPITIKGVMRCGV
jgi:Flp pilus assembly protein TadG